MVPTAGSDLSENAIRGTELVDDRLSSRVVSYTQSSLFSGEPDILHGPNPYRRMLVTDAVAEVDFSRPLRLA